MEEPAITVNGVRLTTGQAMTVRVALSHFALDLKEDGLGDDDHGLKMVEGYQGALAEIYKMIGG